jgi:aryl-alcohol dehydrogenase-like predicted oxidoreductase
MKHAELGNTGRRVSRICLGTMTWGEQNTEAEGHAQLDFAVERGVDFIDAAEMYPVPPKAETYGRTEEILGTWLARNKAKRDKLTIATKVSSRSQGFAYVRGGNSPLDERNIRLAIEASLRRLRTDYIDLYQTHTPDRPVNRMGVLDYVHQPMADQGAPIEETVAAMEKLRKEGKIRHFGVSNETPWGVAKHLEASRAGRGPRIASIQNAYSLLNRSFEIGLAEMAIKEKIGLLAYSALGMGVLTGKYFDGARPEGARLSLYERFKRYSTPRAEPGAKEYARVAREAGLDPAQMAIAFAAARPFVTSVIVGATNLEQLAADIAAVDIDLPAELMAKLDAVHAANPNPCP